MQNVAFRLTMTMKKSLKGWAASVLQRIPWQNRGVAGDSRETYHKLRLKITGCFLGPRRKLLRVMDSKASAFNSSNNSSFSCPDTDHVLGVISFSVVFMLGCLGNFSSTRSNFEERRSIKRNQLVPPQSTRCRFNPDFLVCTNLSCLHRTQWVALYARFSQLQRNLFRHSMQCNCLRTNAFLVEFGTTSGCGSPTKREGNSHTLRLRQSMNLKEVIKEMSNDKEH